MAVGGVASLVGGAGESLGVRVSLGAGEEGVLALLLLPPGFRLVSMSITESRSCEGGQDRW